MRFRSKQGLCLRFTVKEQKTNCQFGHPFSVYTYTPILYCDCLHCKTVTSNYSVLLGVLNVFIKHLGSYVENRLSLNRA